MLNTAHIQGRAAGSMSKTPSLKDFRRIVVKVGSSLLVDSAAGSLKRGWLELARRRHRGASSRERDIIVVSSGAIALGRAVLKLPAGTLKLEEARPPPRSARSRWRVPGRNH